MGDYHIGLPVGAEWLDDCESNHTRTGKDGADILFTPFGADIFFGDVLEGKWLKYTDGVIIGPFTALITGGSLEITGEAAVAGNDDYGWIISKNKFWLFNENAIDVHLKLPGHSAAQDFWVDLYLTDDDGGMPDAAINWIYLQLWTDSTTYKIRVRKNINGAISDDLAATAITNAEGTFRIKFQPVDSHYHVYFKDGAGAVDEDSDEVAGSPFTNYPLFESCYVAYMMTTSEDATRTVTSDSIKINHWDRLTFTTGYSGFTPKYSISDVNVNKGDCKIFDQRGEASEDDWQRVLNTGHPFSGDCVIQNSLTRLWIDEGAVYGLKLYTWISAAWNQPMDKLSILIPDDSKDLSYPFLKKIDYLTKDKIIVYVRLEDSITQDGDYYVDVKITLERGKYHIIVELDEVYPQHDIMPSFNDSSTLRWGFSGDAKLGDADLAITGDDTTMSDNFMVAFDDAGVAVIAVLATTKIPDTDFNSSNGGNLLMRDITYAEYDDLKLAYGILPFAEIANLFCEAETAPCVTDGVDTADGTASGGWKVVLNAQNEYVRWDFTAGTDLPAGRYMVLIRAMDSNQVNNDFEIYVENNSDGEYRNQENDVVVDTLTGAWLYYPLVFDITSADATGTDTIRINVKKDQAGANDMSIDHFWILPYGNGESWPQDIAHEILREPKLGIIRAREI